MQSSRKSSSSQLLVLVRKEAVTKNLKHIDLPWHKSLIDHCHAQWTNSLDGLHP